MAARVLVVLLCVAGAGLVVASGPAAPHPPAVPRNIAAAVAEALGQPAPPPPPDRLPRVSLRQEASVSTKKGRWSDSMIPEVPDEPQLPPVPDFDRPPPVMRDGTDFLGQPHKSPEQKAKETALVAKVRRGRRRL